MEEELKEWMDQFVRVRLIQCNSVDLNLFHFDYDLTFAAFFLNADKTVYGRYGTRSSQKEAERDISIEGFAKAMQKALELHKAYPANKDALAGKVAPFSAFKIPQDFPHLEGRFQPWLDFEGKVAASCIHCHMVGEANRRYQRSKGLDVADKIIYPWPMPDVLGFSLDPKEVASVTDVSPGSPADASGIQPGDEIINMGGQPILSIADVQWVIHQAKEPSTILMELMRDGHRIQATLPIAKGWRRASDIGWRTTSWDLRRMATGGLKMRTMTEDEKKANRLSPDQLALLVEHVGKYGDHAIAHRAGLKQGDIVIEFDDISTAMRETEIFAHVLRNRPAGTEVNVKVMRNGQEQSFQFKLP